MADRSFARNVRGLNADVVKIYVKFQVSDETNDGVTAASFPYNLGVTNVTMDGTNGLYTINLQDTYRGLLGCHAIADDTGASEKVAFEVETDDVANATQASITLLAFDTGGSAESLADNTNVWVELTLLNSNS